jgi:hypothetical protein
MRTRTVFGVVVSTSFGVVGLAVPVTPANAVDATRPLVISEFRVRGPNGANDEFVEVYNASGSDHTVAAASGTGYGVAASDGTTRFSIPNGTVIPARGHYLGVNSVGYSLASYPAGNGTTATGDATYTTDIPDNAGIALFDNDVGGASYAVATRLDAVGSTAEANTLYREGAGYAALTPFSIDYSFVRFQDSSNTVLDTDDNAADLMFVDTNGTSAGAGQRLGAPGPENISSPPFHGSATLAVTPADPGAGAMAAPNLVRDFTSDPANNSTFGTVTLRRKVTNNTGASITRLRIRLSDQSTFPAPSGLADLRGRTSADVVVALTGGGSTTARGTTLEQPASQPNGSGFNSTLSAGIVTLATPLANGASVDLNLLFGIQQTGLFRLGLEFNALPAGGASADICGATDAVRPTDVCVLAPVNTIPADRTITGSTTFSGGAFAVTDYAEDTSLAVTLDATHGTLTLSTTGLTFITGDGAGDTTMTFTGLIADVNAALDTLVYSATTGYGGPATITITSDDQGRTWPAPHLLVVDANATDSDVVNLTVEPLDLKISEFRVRGPNGANDEFVEILNASDADLTVQATDASSGFALAASNGVARFVIPNGTVIPARGHFLGVNSVGYSLASYPAGNGTTATGDATYTTDIPDNVGIALFDNATPASFTLAHRLDAVGSASEANTLYKEGTGYAALTPFSIDYSFHRSLASGTDADTNDNAADFVFADTNGTSAGAGQRLGAPGPENLSSPVRDGSGTTPLSRIDTAAGHLVTPNVNRDLTSDPANNSTFGTLTVRRRLTNDTGVPITRLRFRLREVSTFPSPSGVADLRPRSSTNSVVALTSGTANVLATVLEQPPSQPNGGGFNSTLSVPTVTAATPLADGASIDVGWLFGVQQAGLYRLGVTVETLPGGSSTFVVCGDTDGAYLASADGDQCGQAPHLTVPGVQATDGSTPVVLTGATAPSVADADDRNGTMTVTAVGGTVTLSGLTGLSFSAGDGTSDTVMTFNGLLTDIDAALDGLSYVANAAFTGAGSIAFLAADDGATWPGTSSTDPGLTDTKIVTVNVGAVDPGDFFSLPPTRVLDTRIGLGAPTGKVGPGATRILDVTGVAGVPATGVKAVYVNVTETANTAAGYVTVWPSGGAVPTTSNLSFAKSQTKANAMVVKVGTDGNIRLRNTAAAAHLVVDVVGYATTALVPGGGKFTPLARPRIVDTRYGTGTPATPIPAGGSITVQLTGSNGIPSNGVGAVLVNLTAVTPSVDGYLTVHPSNVARPIASSINFQHKRNIANLLVARLSPTGQVTIYNSSGFTHVLFDLVGYYSDGAVPPPVNGGLNMLATAKRVVDTRTGLGSIKAPLGRGSIRTIDLTGVGGIPASGVGSVILNLTATNTNAGSYLTQYPSNETLPVTSTLNWVAGATVNNYVVAKVGPGGLVKIYNYNGRTDVLVDVVGWYAG